MHCEYFESVFGVEEVTIASGGVLIVDVSVGVAEDRRELVMVVGNVLVCFVL